MMSWNDVLMQEEIRAARRDEARHHRLVQTALGVAPRRTSITHRMMAWVGGLFVAWGWRLQARYGDLFAPEDGSPPGSLGFTPNRLTADTSPNSQPCT